MYKLQINKYKSIHGNKYIQLTNYDKNIKKKKKQGVVLQGDKK